jgi:uncharacterized protein (DUF3084 family)
MSRSKTMLVMLVSGGLGAATLQIVHAASTPAQPSVRQLDDQWPHMHHALDDLRHARHSLEDAEDHFKGHRQKALDHVDAAIKECEDAISEG